VLDAKRHVCAFFHSPDEETGVASVHQRWLRAGREGVHIVDPKLRMEHAQRLASPASMWRRRKKASVELRNWLTPICRCHFDQDRMLALIQEVLDGGIEQGSR